MSESVKFQEMGRLQNELTGRFISSETPITQEQIERYVRKIVDAYNSNQESSEVRIMLVLSGLESDSLFRRGVSFKDSDSMNVAKEALNQVRKRVVEELKKYLVPSDFLVVEKILSGNGLGSVSEIIDGNKQKKVLRHIHFDGNNPKRREPWLNHIRALEKLSQLPECPYVVPFKQAASNNSVEFKRTAISDSAQSFSALADKFNLESLVSTYSREDISPQNFKKMLRIILENMQGGEFLLDNGIVLMDICVSNLGYDKEHDRGILFDLGFVYPKTAKTNGYYSRYGYELPEFKTPNKLTEVTEKQMVYQFGLCLKEIEERLINRDKIVSLPDKQRDLFFQLDEKLGKLIAEMTSIKSDKRLSYQESLNRLQQIIDEINI